MIRTTMRAVRRWLGDVRPGGLRLVPPGANVGLATPCTDTATRRHIRGSSLLVVGRLMSLGINFFVQVLTVRYLAKSDYGAFAYALSIVSIGADVALLGLNRALNRFVPIYHEQRDYGTMFGTIILVMGSVVGLGVALVALVFGLQGFLTQSVVNNPLSVGLLLILIALLPAQALDNLLRGMLTVFAGPREIFFQKYVVVPGLKLGAVLLVILMQEDVYFLATCYLLRGLLGVVIYVVMLERAFARHALWERLNLKSLRMPARTIFGFSVPLLTTDLLETTTAVIMLEYFRGTTDVAEFWAVSSLAELNNIILQSLELLYTPLAARLFARHDVAGLNDLYWQSTIWITIVTFPIFAVCFFLAEPVTVLLFGSRYASAASILAILAVGEFCNAALGLNRYTLLVYARVRLITSINVLGVLIRLGLNFWLIPRYGALGAAIATSGALVAHNLLNHTGLWLATAIDLLQWHYLKVYLSIAMSTLGLFILRVFLHPPVPFMILLMALTTLLLLRINRRSLAVADTFPELARVPVLRTVLAVERT
jgi:O-antigen/teichoic acid export membrane protein